MAPVDAPDTADTGRPTRNTRNPRRRARPDSDSIKVAPRRKRSKITETTFLPREEDTPDPSEDGAQMNGHASRSPSRPQSVRKASGLSMNGSLDIPVRGRQSAKRVSRVDNATTLTQNESYSIRLLPSTPSELRRDGIDFRASIDAQSSLALAITHNKAYIWDYTGHGGLASTRTVEIPPALSSDTAPAFGAIVPGTNANDIGLVLVSSQTGKAVYHESVNRIASLSFLSEPKHGVHGTINGLFSGERVIQFSSAHPAGFLALLNSGRVVHLSLRDAQGKPKVQSQVLYTSEQSTGGIFGSIKSILGAASWKQAIAAVRTRVLERGQVEVLGMLERGELRIWDIDWSGQSAFRSSIDFREQLQNELRQMRTGETASQVDRLAIVDFAVTDRSHLPSQDLIASSAERPVDVTILVRCGYEGLESLYVAQLSFTAGQATIRRVLTLQQTAAKDPTDFRPRLLIPGSGNTAFIIQSTSITVLSLLIAASDPEAQLHEASYIEPEPYQDTIYLHDRPHNILLGGECDTYRAGGDASSILFVQGSGLLKLSAHQTRHELESFEIVKSKLEQAVFYGTQEGNIFDLSRPGETRFAVEDVERAAVQLSNDIISSSSRFLEIPPVSIEASLVQRAAALHALAQIIQKSYPRLSKGTMWRLLSQAEKLAASIRLWPIYESEAQASKSKRVAPLWHEIIQCMQSKSAFDSIYEHSTPDDLVRTFFVTQLDNLSQMLEWACRIIISLAAKDSDTPAAVAIKVTSEADDIWLGCMETVFDFRTSNAALYGIALSKLEEGVASHPADLRNVDEIWTSSSGLLSQVARMTEEARQSAAESYESEPDPTTEKYALKIAEENARLIEISCLMFRERILWCRSRDTAKYDDQAEKLQLAYDATRHGQIRALAQVGQTQAGLRLAEKYRDMDTLTEMIVAETQYLCENRIGASQAERQAIDAELEKNNKRVSKYFEFYGDEWSEAFFGHSLQSGTAGHLLSQVQDRWKAPLTEYLRKEPSRAKLCWINDILKEDDFERAGEALLDIATMQEEKLWSKRVQLSLAKLTMNAQWENAGGHVQATADTAHQQIDKNLAFLDVEQRLYEHISPATYHSLDAEAAVKDALSSFARSIQHAPVHYSLLAELVSKLLQRKSLKAVELIDLLTLTDASAASQDDKDINRSETFEALTALYASPQISPAEFDLLLKLIWKRAFLQEDWEQLNNISSQEGDAAVREHVVQTNLYRVVHSILDAKYDKPSDRFRILEPEQTVNAGCFIGDLPSYVPADVVEEYLEENVQMEREFEDLIATQRLDSWLQDITRFAKDAIWAAAEERDATNLQWNGGSGGAAVGDALHANGHGANGITNGIKTEDQDDVQMHFDGSNDQTVTL